LLFKLPISFFLFWRPLFIFVILLFKFIFLGQRTINNKFAPAYDSVVLLLQPWQVLKPQGFLFDFHPFFNYFLFLLDKHVSQVLLRNLRIFLRFAIPYEILKCILNRDYQFWEADVFHDVLDEDRECLERVTKDFFLGCVAEKVCAFEEDVLVGTFVRSDRAVSNFGEICLIGNREGRNYILTDRNENIASIFAQEV
jgi:hypothetical protein